MALPTLLNSWDIRSNIAIIPSTSCRLTNQRWHWEWKNSLKLLGATISGSCDCVTSGMDGVDRWTDYTKVLYNNTGVKSWIVLRFPGIATQFELCFFCSISDFDGVNTTMVMSVVGFGAANGGGNGSTSARPTATDEITLWTNASALTGSATYNTNWYDAHRGHFWVEASAQSMFYWARTMRGKVLCFGGVGLAANAPEELPSPIFIFGGACDASGNGAAVRTAWANNAYTSCKVPGSATVVPAYMTQEVYNSSYISAYQIFPGELSGGYPMLPVGLWSATYPLRGRLGRVPDLFWGAESNVSNGDTYPDPDNANRKSFVQLGDFVFPWDGSDMIVAG